MNALEIVRTALHQNSLSGIIEILGAIAIEARATGAIIWEANPDACLNPTEPSGSLFVLAQWFRAARHQPSSDLDVSTAIGMAIVHRTRLNVSVRATASMHRPLSVLKWNHGGIGKAASQTQEPNGS